MEKPKTGYIITRWVFIRILSLIYLAGFLSLGAQISGLYGQDGILPISRLVSEQSGQPLLLNILNHPSVFWLSSSDSTLIAVPAIGAMAAISAFIGILTGPCLVISWFLYLSVMSVGQDFMSFQWDILLNEIGFLSIFFCEWRPLSLVWNKLSTSLKIPAWAIDRSQPSMIVLWLYRWLLFRLMFASGAVKLASEDPTWSNLTALTYHYETQPLPTPLGYFAHHLPGAIQIASTGCMFFIELFVPFLIFAPRKIRYIAAAFLIFLQILILLTGNYCFFNWLTIALCLLLFDDSVFEMILRRMKGEAFIRLFATIDATRKSRRNLLIQIPIACLVVGLSMSRSPMFGMNRDFPEPFYSIMVVAEPWRLVGNYGLFAVMTTSRPEIVMEGSADGITWKEYVFKFKPGPLNRPPPVVAPHQPRLDWQMWFAALSESPDDLWFFRLTQKLLDGSQSVTDLLETNPFAGSRPKFVRAQLYDYRFTSPEVLFRTGRWWTRTHKKTFLPPVSIKD